MKVNNDWQDPKKELPKKYDSDGNSELCIVQYEDVKKNVIRYDLGVYNNWNNFWIVYDGVDERGRKYNECENVTGYSLVTLPEIETKTCNYCGCEVIDSEICYCN